jgi:hypothetical protein
MNHYFPMFATGLGNCGLGRTAARLDGCMPRPPSARKSPISTPDGPDLRQHTCMADRWRAPGGWTVEVVRLSLTPDRHDGEWIRLKQFGAFHADVRTPAEVERWVPLADLEQDTLALAA